MHLGKREYPPPPPPPLNLEQSCPLSFIDMPSWGIRQETVKGPLKPISYKVECRAKQYSEGQSQWRSPKGDCRGQNCSVCMCLFICISNVPSRCWLPFFSEVLISEWQYSKGIVTLSRAWNVWPTMFFHSHKPMKHSSLHFLHGETRSAGIFMFLSVEMKKLGLDPDLSESRVYVFPSRPQSFSSIINCVKHDKRNRIL